MIEEDELWPDEEKALQDIMDGKTKMVTVTLEEFLKELED